MSIKSKHKTANKVTTVLSLEKNIHSIYMDRFSHSKLRDPLPRAQNEQRWGAKLSFVSNSPTNREDGGGAVRGKIGF